MTTQVVPMLPCAEVGGIADFWTALGFDLSCRQTRPNPYVALEGYGFPLHYYGLAGHRPETSHSTCGIVVDSIAELFEAWSTRLRRRDGKLPLSGYPRITRPRPGKNASGLSGFTVVDPAGNWIRVMQGGGTVGPPPEASPLRESLSNAVVLADSLGDTAQASRILRGAVRRADGDDPAMAEALDFLAELDSRVLGQEWGPPPSQEL